ncbi:hypothetical protein Bpfe_029291, partial [Biomphalaria pfeifferi]
MTLHAELWTEERTYGPSFQGHLPTPGESICHHVVSPIAIMWSVQWSSCPIALIFRN